MKHILFVTPDGFVGGAEVNLLRIICHLPKNKFSVTVVLPDEGPLKDELLALGVHLVFYPADGLRDTSFFKVFKTALKIKTLIKKQAVDIIHGNSIVSMYPTIYLGFLLKKPVVLHAADYHCGPGDRQLINTFSKKVKVVAVSQDVADYFVNQGVTNHQVTVLHNGTVEPGPCKAGWLKKEPGIIYLGLTGRIDDWKGHDYALEALSNCKDKNLKLLVFGEARSEKAKQVQAHLKSKIKALGLTGSVMFTGFLKEPWHTVNQMDIIIAPSEFEPFGLVAIEAMALKKPVIASRIGGLQEIVEHEKTGILCEAKNIHALTGAIHRLSSQPSLRKTYGEAGYLRFKETFSIEKMVDGLVAIYDNAMASISIK